MPLEAPLYSNDPSSREMAEFQAWVRATGLELYRDLPWRNTRDPYAIWISETMLQQTQVSRVLARWERFLKTFPTLDSLACASVADVVEAWQGLGYNRRAIALKRAADICSADYGGHLPEDMGKLMELSGIGEATAAGITAFSRDAACVYLETNVRSVFIHCFFRDANRVTDRQLKPLVQQACPASGVRAWYYALLDIGARLKKDYKNPSRVAAAYTRQSTFEGSRRQKRAWLVREVLASPGATSEELLYRLNAEERRAGRDGVGEDDFESMMADLSREGFFKGNSSGWVL